MLVTLPSEELEVRVPLPNEELEINIIPYEELELTIVLVPLLVKSWGSALWWYHYPMKNWR